MGIKHDDARTRAVRILTRVIKDGLTLDRVIPELSAGLDSPRDRAFIRELCYGVLRWYPRLEFHADKLLGRPLKKKELDVKAAILCGLYQLEYLRTPEHAAVSASVDVATHLGKPWARSVINAVLRRYQRESDSLKREADACEVANFAHPRWLISALQNDWPRHWQHILRAANERPPMHLRVNLSRTSRADYLQELALAEMAQRLRVLFFALSVAIPAVILVIGVHSAWILGLTAVGCLGGLLVERWLFFAEAQHVVRLFHGQQSV